MKRRRIMRPVPDADPSAFLPEPEPVEQTHKPYADYLREARPSRHEVPAPRQHDDAAAVRDAIERVKSARPVLRRQY